MESFSLFGYSIPWLDALVLLCTLGYGAHIVYIAIRLRKENHVFQSELLIPRGRKEEECIAPEGYIRFLIPRLFLMGILLVLLGVFNFVWPIIVTERSLPYMLGLAGIVPILAVLFLFNFTMKKAFHDFWP